MPDQPPPLLEVGTVFGIAKDAYKLMLKNEETAFDIRDRAIDILVQARTTATRLEGEDLAKAQNLIQRAEIILPQMDAMIIGLQKERLTVLMRTINSIGSTIPRLRKIRAQVTMVDPSDWDKRFEGLVMRYEGVYRPLFPVGEGGVIGMPDVAQMTPPDWDRLRTHAEGPIYLWDIDECRNKWVVAGVRPCDGPDYLAALSMINQVMEMWQVEILQWGEFPMLTFYDSVLDGAIGRSAEYLTGVEKLLQDLAEILKALSEIALKITGTAADIAKGIAKTPGWLLAAAAVGAFVLLRRKKEG
jgi:hypothetical protein